LTTAAQTSLCTCPFLVQKCCCQDRTIIATTDAERVAVSPPELQPAINKIVAEAGSQVSMDNWYR